MGKLQERDQSDFADQQSSKVSKEIKALIQALWKSKEILEMPKTKDPNWAPI